MGSGHYSQLVLRTAGGKAARGPEFVRAADDGGGGALPLYIAQRFCTAPHDHGAGSRESTIIISTSFNRSNIRLQNLWDGIELMFGVARDVASRGRQGGLRHEQTRGSATTATRGTSSASECSSSKDAHRN